MHNSNEKKRSTKDHWVYVTRLAHNDRDDNLLE